MKTILWAQSSGKGADDYYFIDGQLSSNIQNNILAEKQLHKAEMYAPILMSHKKELRNRLNSPNFILSYVPGYGFLYKSIFNELANDGRKASFVALFTKDVSSTIWFDLVKAANSINRSLRDNEKAVVESYVKKKLILIRSLIILFILISLTIICHVI